MDKVNIIDRLIILNEHSNALLLRLSDFKAYCDCPQYQPPVIQQLQQAKCWPLTSFNEVDPDQSKMDNCEKANIKKEQVLNELEPFANLASNFVEIRNASLVILTEIGSSYNQFKNYELRNQFIISFNRHIKMHMLLSSFKSFKSIVGSYLFIHQSVKHTNYPDHQMIVAFLKAFNFNEPITFLHQELEGLTRIVEATIPTTSDIVRWSKDPQTLGWLGPLGVYEGDKLISYLQPSEDEEEEEESEKKEEENGNDLEPIYEQQQISMQITGEAHFFNIFAFLMCPEIIRQTQQLEEIEGILSDCLSVPLYGDEVFYPHAAYEALFNNFKSKTLKIDKSMPSKALEAAWQTGPYKASVRRTLLLTTGQRLLQFFLEDPQLHAPVCCENGMTVVALCAAEVSSYFAHVKHPLPQTKKKLGVKDTDFEDWIGIARLFDLMVRMRDALALMAADVSVLCRNVLMRKSTKALKFALDDIGKGFDSSATSVLRKVLEVLKTAGQSEKSIVPLEKEHLGWTALQLCRLECLRMMCDMTTNTSRQSSAHQTLWPILQKIGRMITLADPQLFAETVDSLGATHVLIGNMTRLVHVLNGYLDSGDAKCDVTSTLIRAPYLLKQLSNPLFPATSRYLKEEAAFLWTKTFVYLVVRKIEECLAAIIIVTVRKQREASSITKLADAIIGTPEAGASSLSYQSAEVAGKESHFSMRDNLSRVSAAQTKLVCMLTALYSMTGKPSSSGSSSSSAAAAAPSSSSTPSQPSSAAPVASTFPPLFTYALTGLEESDGIIHLNSDHICLGGILSVMLSRLLSSMFAHVCSLPINHFSVSATTQLIADFVSDPPVFPFVPAGAEYDFRLALAVGNRLRVGLSNIARPAAVVSSGKEGTGSSLASSSSSTSLISAGVAATAHQRDKSILSFLDYEADPPSVWWNPPAALSLDTLRPAITANAALKGDCPAPVVIKENEWPVAPSVALAVIKSIVSAAKVALHLPFPSLQVDEIAQRVMLNMCVVPAMTAPGMCLDRTMPVGAWFYRLFGREKTGWMCDGTEADPLSSTATASSTQNITLENDGPTTGYIAMLYGRWYADMFCSILASHESVQTVFSCQENGFIRPPSSTASSSSSDASAASTITSFHDQIMQRVSGFELRCLAELVGPLGVEAICEMIEGYALPRHLLQITIFLRSNQQTFEMLKRMNVDALGDNTEQTTKQIRGKEMSEFLLPLIGIGASCHLIQVLKEAVHTIFTMRLPLTAETLRTIANAMQLYDPRCTLSEVCRIYSLTRPSSDGEAPALSALPSAGTAGAETWESAFFAYVHNPQGKGFHQSYVGSLFPYACLSSLSSGAVWQMSIYLPQVGGFDNNMHCAARGMVYAAHALSEAKHVPASVRQAGLKEGTLHESIVKLLINEPGSAQGLLWETMDVCTRVVLQSDWDDDVKWPTLEKRLIFLEKLYEDMKWMGTANFEGLVPRFLLKSAKAANWRVEKRE
ncbi:putative Membrane-associated apoptosis protein [Monocercomonoides exilis]|uniref:putative Membrane-associated apoptosis protein n=1 Tax=Monocercomonoides exilis TaxID=2049356 RepID=UPI0035593BE1|nr:putative Membrane-associated apoptosis protein [Monocercomonoides exilis]|eukprot:MONOS_6702.1-p1 / transcript=MONOS_6702.1 / gene=MONOS_6702 / organism=Monocercomonoides_exilis_PA203 / gene_product=unspecified product / transcript_product=unspecified product / location=Mono_scaffold00216:17176-21805(+) / protein_length=1474 / sequence_SO=supercontig / SO=protein_coding / is_pseudo=false